MTDLTQALPLLSVVAGGVILLATFARDPKANEHAGVDDYKEVEERAWHRGFDTARRYPRPMVLGPGMTVTPIADDILPPAPEGMDAGSPIYRALISEQIVAEQMREQFGITDPDRIADVMLREIRDEALAGAR